MWANGNGNEGGDEANRKKHIDFLMPLAFIK